MTFIDIMIIAVECPFELQRVFHLHHVQGVRMILSFNHMDNYKTIETCVNKGLGQLEHHVQ